MSLSHIVTIKTEIRDVLAIRSACRRLGLNGPVQGKTRLFSGEAEGWAVQLPQWRFPAVCDTTTGIVHFDNFGGRWGEQKELDRFLQAYTVERAKLEVRRKGHSVTESLLADGSVKLTVQVTGGAP
ncbi:MAG: DUF1257 domain-containing protein [Pirellulales bacterium]|nr:DUF1257 domain-containing protein [Pirellulales bacterium]